MDYAYEVDAVFNALPASVAVDREGPPRRLSVEVPARAPTAGGEATLALRYRIARRVEVDESGSLTTRFPIAHVSWPVRPPGPGAVRARLRLPPGIALDEASPGEWTREEEATSRLLYRQAADALPEVVEVRASAMPFGQQRRERRYLRLGLGLGALSLLAVALWLLRRRFTAR